MYFVKAACARAGDSQNHAYEQKIHQIGEYEQEILKIGEYEQEIHKIGKLELKIQNRCKSHAYEQKIHKSAYEPKGCNARNRVIRPNVMTHPCNQVDADRVAVETGAEPITIPCEPSSHLNSTNVSSAPSKDSELPTVQCDYLVSKDVAASDGLKVLSMYVKSFGYGTSTLVGSKGSTGTFAVTWRVKILNCLGLSDIILQCDPEPSLIKWAKNVKSKRQERTVI